MREFELIFCHRKGLNPISWIIRKLQNFSSSHCVLHWRSERLSVDMYYDASIQGVSFKNQKEFDRDYKVDYRIAFETEDFDQLLRFCIDNLHKSYSFSLLFYHFFLVMGFRISFLSRGKDPMCTTLAALALSSVGINLNAPVRELDLVTLYKLALEYKGAVQNG
jgi:hypothetical protein